MEVLEGRPLYWTGPQGLHGLEHSQAHASNPLSGKERGLSMVVASSGIHAAVKAFEGLTTPKN